LCLGNLNQSILGVKKAAKIMFLLVHRFMEIINDLELSHRFTALNSFSIPGDKSDEPQKDILDDDLLLLFLFSLSS
jgi:hypothetical protein